MVLEKFLSTDGYGENLSSSDLWVRLWNSISVSVSCMDPLYVHNNNNNQSFYFQTS
jgi:hypothetical protein